MHEVLEEEQWPVDAAEFSARWESVAWPQKLKRKQEECEAALAADRDSFQNEMVEEQAQFGRDVEELAQRVANFHQYTDIARVTKVNAIVNEIQATLVEYEAKANLFNKRESLFGSEATTLTPTLTLTLSLTLTLTLTPTPTLPLPLPLILTLTCMPESDQLMHEPSAEADMHC